MLRFSDEALEQAAQAALQTCCEQLRQRSANALGYQLNPHLSLLYSHDALPIRQACAAALDTPCKPPALRSPRRRQPSAAHPDSRRHRRIQHTHQPIADLIGQPPQAGQQSLRAIPQSCRFRQIGGFSTGVDRLKTMHTRAQ